MNRIGLNQEKAESLSNQLNDLLANYQLFYMNVRGFHWNIKGNKFFELHVKFEELYNDLQIKIDEIAERVLTLESTPKHSFTDYLETSEIKSLTNITGSEETVNSVLESFKTSDRYLIGLLLGIKFKSPITIAEMLLVFNFFILFTINFALSNLAISPI